MQRMGGDITRLYVYSRWRSSTELSCRGSSCRPELGIRKTISKTGRWWYIPCKGTVPPRQGTFEVPPASARRTHRPCPVRLRIMHAHCRQERRILFPPAHPTPPAKRHPCLPLCLAPWRVFNAREVHHDFPPSPADCGLDNPLRSIPSCVIQCRFVQFNFHLSPSLGSPLSVY